MRLLQILLIPLLLISLSVQAADIQVSVDRNPIYLNDSFQLIFTASEEPDGNPDFSPLQENFEYLDQQHSSNVSWVNGQSSRSEKWVVSLLAKQAGELLIPPISFGRDLSKPLHLNVTANQSTPQSNDDMFLDVTATPDKPYVQSQVLYTLRFFRRLQIIQAKLEEPQLKDAVVEKLGEDSTYTTQINGVDYAVTERKYAIFPQQSGSVTIAPLNLSAEVVSSHRPQFNGFFNQQTSETRRIVSKAITLNVQPVPESFKPAAWLSAESLEISDDWSAQTLQTKVGEPLTRTLKLVAKGSTVGQLPELLAATPIDGLKSYPDQPVLKEDKQSDGLTAIREEKIAFIPSKPGDFALPPIEISWFNTKTQQIETARLPAVTIKAVANAELANQTMPTPSVSQSVPNQINSIQAADVDDVRIWQAVSALLALGWLLTVILFFYRHERSLSVPEKKIRQAAPQTISDADLKSACLENDPQLAKQVLLQWGKTEFSADSLAEIAKYCPTPLAAEIEGLNQYLYSEQTSIWQGKLLWETFNARVKPQGKPPEQDTGLEPLYKL
ncbi:BatD family protein [Methylomonas sp. AM2-LC]|uniref:BatD family protein n=1 Tax=Methylomonas sp. AM2-LC TaxID=3153301 RepID=UPI0032673833